MCPNPLHRGAGAPVSHPGDSYGDSGIYYHNGDSHCSHGHHLSIQEVDHEKQMFADHTFGETCLFACCHEHDKQMFADLLASVHELLAEYSTSELCLLGWPNDYSYTSEYCLAHWPYEYKYLWGE